MHTKKVKYSPTLFSDYPKPMYSSFSVKLSLISWTNFHGIPHSTINFSMLISQCFVTFFMCHLDLFKPVLQMWMLNPILSRLWPWRAASMTVTFTRSGYSGYEECWAVDRKGNRNCFWTDINCKIFCVTWYQLFLESHMGISLQGVSRKLAKPVASEEMNGVLEYGCGRNTFHYKCYII